MSRLIKRLTMTLILASMLLVLVTGTVFANQQIKDPSFGIEVSPNVLNIGSPGENGHIHSNIPFGGVESVELRVEGLDYNCTIRADSIGDLVVEFDLSVLKEDLKNQETATFKLIFKYDGNDYELTDTIDVIQSTQ